MNTTPIQNVIHPPQERINWFEYQLARLIETRRMRVTKAISRIFHTDEATTHTLSKLWDGKSFNVTVCDDVDTWTQAYENVRSCMRNKGKECHEAYTPQGVVIAVLHRDGLVSARALVRGCMFPAVYGEDHYLLEAVLTGVLKLKESDEWLKGAGSIGVYRVETITELLPFQGMPTGRFLDSPPVAFDYRPSWAYDHAKGYHRPVYEIITSRFATYAVTRREKVCVCLYHILTGTPRTNVWGNQ